MAMPKSLKDRVGILEEQMGTLEGLPEAVGSLTLQISQLSTRMDNGFSAIRMEWNATLERRFREQAEMLDERFAQVNGDLTALRTEVGTLRTEVGTLRTEVNTLRTEVNTLGNLRDNVSALGKDLRIVREGVGIILKKLDTR